MTKAEASVSSPRSTAAEAANHASVSVSATEAGHPVIFFDGVCGLCNRFVDFVIRHDRQGVFRLAPLQGETARDRLAEADVVDLKTVVLVDASGTYRKSTAVLRVLGRLGTFWKFAAALLWVIPRPHPRSGILLDCRQPLCDIRQERDLSVAQCRRTRTVPALSRLRTRG